MYKRQGGDPRAGRSVAREDRHRPRRGGGDHRRPFAEAKEQPAGFSLVECETPERTVETVARMPEARFGLIEVRPILDLGGAEM